MAGSGPNSSTGTSPSLSGFLATLIPVGLTALAFFVLFLVFRAKYQRVYRPRTYLQTLPDSEKSSQLPDGRFAWFSPFRSIPDEYVLNHQSLDGYLYLRFLKMLTIICFVGCCITWPILFPITATAGGGQKQFDLLSLANVPKTHKNRYYAHALVGWVFFSFVIYIITQETIYFINLRRAYLMAPFNAAKMSSRTVLFTDVAAEYLNVEALRKLFGASMVRAWISTDCKELQKLVDERDKTAMKLEGAEIKLIKGANDKRLKSEKKNGKVKEPTPRPADPAAAEAATVSSPWLDKKDRPAHRLGKIPLIGKKVDTIEWCRTELETLVPKVKETQTTHRKLEAQTIPAVFVEFTTQAAAQLTYRRMSPRLAPKMDPRAVGVAPKDVIWKNLKLKKNERRLRRIGTNTFLTLMIIFWAIPVAIIGAISNINSLTQKVHFLSFINDVPGPILGVITGLLPSVLLAVLMALVPVVCRLMAKLSGEVTLPRVELRTQNWYFAFQVVQVFLITTFASGAAAVVSGILSDPSSATSLLAANLPKASNFYVSYFIVQGLGIASGNLLNIGGLAMLTVVGKFLDKSPRKMYNRYITLAGLGWGSLYPKFGNLGVIALAYAIIAPLVLGFATVGFALVYLATRYNAFYVVTNTIDTKGAAYAKAIHQLMVGVYISEVCLLGLFGINTAFGPLVLMAIFLGLTVAYHVMLNQALAPLKLYLPATLENYDASELFLNSDVGKYDVSKSATTPPSEFAAPEAKKLSVTKAKLFAKVFDLSKFKSYNSVLGIVPSNAPPAYEDLEVADAYLNPAATTRVPQLWIPRDEMGVSRTEVRETEKVVRISDDLTHFNDKGKIVWDDTRLESVPIWEKRIDY